MSDNHPVRLFLTGSLAARSGRLVTEQAKVVRPPLVAQRRRRQLVWPVTGQATVAPFNNVRDRRRLLNRPALVAVQARVGWNALVDGRSGLELAFPMA